MAERRRHERISVEVRVELKHLGRPGETPSQLVRDVSAGGLFVESTVGLELGTSVTLEVAPGPGVAPIRINAEVIRVEQAGALTGSKTTSVIRGMALRFQDAASPEVKRLIALAEQMRGQGNRGGTSDKFSNRFE